MTGRKQPTYFPSFFAFSSASSLACILPSVSFSAAMLLMRRRGFARGRRRFPFRRRQSFWRDSSAGLADFLMQEFDIGLQAAGAPLDLLFGRCNFRGRACPGRKRALRGKENRGKNAATRIISPLKQRTPASFRRAGGSTARIPKTKKASVNTDAGVLQPDDFVFDLQLATLQLGNFDVIGGGMRERFGNLVLLAPGAAIRVQQDADLTASAEPPSGWGARQYSHESDMRIVASRLPFLVQREKSPFSH